MSSEFSEKSPENAKTHLQILVILIVTFFNLSYKKLYFVQKDWSTNLVGPLTVGPFTVGPFTVGPCTAGPLTAGQQSNH